MAISPRTTKWLAACVGVATATAGLGWGYSFITGGLPGVGLLAGLQIGLILSIFEIFFVQSQTGTWLRRLPLLVFITLASVVWSVVIYFSIYVATPYLLGIDMTDYRFDAEDAKGLMFAFAVALLSTFFLRILSLVGARTLFSFVIGRYHRPRREERVFMFLDIADSTRLSEEFGDVKIRELIGQFFFDIARPIADNGGEIYRYIGDEVVVSWPMSKALAGARCLGCVVDVQELLESRGDGYRRRFGVVPRFRIGMHGGPVVIGEVGDSRRAIVYSGETLGVAATLQGACKRVGQEFLVSADLAKRLVVDERFTISNLGALELFADGTTMDVYALSRTGTDESRNIS